MPIALRAATALSLSLATLVSAGAARAEFTLTVLHVNDFHSRVEPINRYDSTCSAADDAEGKCFGGLARLSTAVADARAAAGNAPILFLNAGDVFQGSLYYTSYKGLAEAELFNAIGVDAMALGNHEFDNGPETLAAFIDKVHFPILSGNVWLGDEPGLKGRTNGYLIVETGGEKVGIVSALTTDTAVISSPGPNVGFSDSVRYLKTIVQEIEAQGVDKIIALTHVGVTEDIAIAGAVPGIDAIIGGHSHTLMSNTVEGATPYPLMVKGPDGRDVPIAHAYAYGKYLGDLRITFDDAGAVIAARGEPLLLDASVAEDASVKARIGEMGAPIEELKTRVIGESAAPIDGDRANCRARVCEMGVLVSEAMLARTRDQGMQVAIQNGGGLRASIDAGPVTMGEVLTVLPFQNTLATFTLTGAQIVAALENGVSDVEGGAGRFPQVAGMRFAWDPQAAPGARVLSVEIAGADGFQPLDPAARYGVVSNNFMRAGGDGYAVFASDGKDAYDFGPGLEDVLADYIAANSPFTPTIDDRIAEGPRN